jgi:PAS domain S-box-containing protein
MKTAGGDWVWVHDTSTGVLGPDGNVRYFLGFLTDITARKEAEKERRQAELERAESEHRYRSLVDNAPDGVMVRVADRFVFANPRAAEILGAGDPSSLIGRPIFEIAHADYHEVIRGRIAAQEEGGEVAPPMHQRFIRVDGALVDVEVGGIPIMWEGERASLVVFRDISEELAAKRQLLEAEATFRTIVERNPAVIYSQTFDPTGDTPSRTTYVSPRQKELLGYTAEEVMADPELWTRQIHPEDRARVLEADLESNRLQESLFSMEYRMVAKDGRVIWVQDQAELVRIRGRPPFWQGFLLDITERKAAQERLEQALEGEHEAADRLRSLDEMKNTFLQAVSHDLRTPLSAILGLAITLERGDRLKLSQEDARELASRIAGNARRLERLVTNLLDMDRLARGIAEPEIEPVDVGTVVRHVIEETGLIHLERLRIDLPELVMPVDPAKLERIVENLLANTARHTPPDATVWVTARLEDGGLLLLVDDDGPGVPPDAREAIFEPFQQGSDVPRHSPGVGVGLTLVRQFAELHGGRAWVEERHGGGASFRVWLPLRPPDAADAG